MHLIVAGIAAGVLGTVVMDLGNHLLARSGAVLTIDVVTIGRMAAGWARGRFIYNDPGEMEPVANEKLLGYAAHYAIGVGLAFIYVFGWALLAEGPASPGWAVVYGLATTAASLFLVYPSMGLGMWGRRSPAGIRAVLSPPANHLFFGVGMAVALMLA